MKFLPRKYTLPESGRLLLIVLLLSVLFSCNRSAAIEDEGTTKTLEDYEQYGEPFNVPDISDIIMYELNVQAFSEQGDFEGVEARLDSIKDLGVNIIWLMPIYPRGEERGIGSPYAIKNYKEVSPDYGTLNDLQELVEGAHEKDMAVILDWVANHTAWDNPWMHNKSWYMQDSKGQVVHPPGTNWQDVAQVNFKNMQMRLAMIDAMKYWVLRANIDGFRADYADGPPDDFWSQAIDSLKGIPNRELILLAEGRKKSHFQSGFDLNFGWNFYGSLTEVFQEGVSVSELEEANTRGYTDVPDGSHPLRFITNHDYHSGESPIDIFGGEEGSIAAFVLASYMGGVPLVYNGQEVGRAESLEFFNSNIEKIDWSRNPDITEEYKKLIRFRKGSEAVKSGSIQHYGNSDDVSVFKRVMGEEEVLIIVNVRDTEIDYEMPLSLANTSWDHAITGNAVNLDKQLTLAPYSYLILSD